MDDQQKHYADKLTNEIDAWDLNQARERGENVIVIDTRSPEAFAAGHIPGALSLPHRAMDAASTAGLDRQALIVTYCDGIGCNASTKGALNLARLGFRVKELIGGLDWWKRDGHAVEGGAPGAGCGCGEAVRPGGAGTTRLPLYQVDAFTQRVFAGNPAAVCPLPYWLPDAVLQAVAAENNLSETAFLVAEGSGWRLRWFTPLTEVDLCGHATLAAAHVLFSHLGPGGPEVVFETRSGRLTVRREADRLVMDFPARPPTPCPAPEVLITGLGCRPLEVLAADDYIAVLADEAAVRAIAPDLGQLATLDRRGVCVTAPGMETDFVSRFFAPRLGIPEDPVTGSAHCELAPYWAGRLGRPALSARQVSRRGGEITCRLEGDRVFLTGQAVTFMVGEMVLET